MTKFKKNTHLSLYVSIDRKYAKCRTKADAHDKMGFQYISISVDIVRSHARIQRGGRGSGHPHLKNHKNIALKNVVRVRIQIRSEWISGKNVPSI